MSESAVPIACTLHPNEMGGRLEEWHRLFAAHLGAIQRTAPTRLRLVLAADAGVGRMRDLAAREMACCAFMTFTVTAGGGRGSTRRPRCGCCGPSRPRNGSGSPLPRSRS